MQTDSRPPRKSTLAVSSGVKWSFFSLKCNLSLPSDFKIVIVCLVTLAFRAVLRGRDVTENLRRKLNDNKTDRHRL